MDSHQNSSIVHVGEYEYNTRDLIGHGAFAVVFKGRQRKVYTHIHIEEKNRINNTYLQYKSIFFPFFLSLSPFFTLIYRNPIIHRHTFDIHYAKYEKHLNRNVIDTY